MLLLLLLLLLSRGFCCSALLASKVHPRETRGTLFGEETPRVASLLTLLFARTTSGAASASAFGDRSKRRLRRRRCRCRVRWCRGCNHMRRCCLLCRRQLARLCSSTVAGRRRRPSAKRAAPNRLACEAIPIGAASGAANQTTTMHS